MARCAPLTDKDVSPRMRVWALAGIVIVIPGVACMRHSAICASIGRPRLPPAAPYVEMRIGLPQCARNLEQY